MRTGLRAAAVAAAIGACGLAMAGCGDDEPGAEGAGGTSSAAAGEPTRVRFGFVPALSALPLYVAHQEGMFERHGIAIELLPTQVISNLAPGLGRQYDAVAATPYDFLQAAARGVDPVALSGLQVATESNHVVEVVAPDGSGISAIEDLRDKRVGGAAVIGSSATAFRNWLRQEGIEPDSVELVEVPFPNQLDQLRSGRVDAVLSVQPFAAQLLQEGNTALGDPFLHVGSPPVLGAFVAAKRSWADEHAALAADLRASLEEAVAYMADHEDVVRQIIEDQLKLPRPVAQSVKLPHWQLELTEEEFADWIAAMDATGAFEGVSAPEPDGLVIDGAS